MGFMIQTQRRAIEQLKPEADGLSSWPQSIFDGKVKQLRSAFYLCTEDGGFGLSYLGTSEGYGTCSDIHGMNVLVFGLQVPEIKIKKEEKVKMAKAAYAALLFEAEEVDNHYEQAVELLAFHMVDESGRVYFKQTGHRAIYVPVL